MRHDTRSAGRAFQRWSALLWPIAILLLIAAPGQAAVINVPGDYSTIQAAINAASTGDEIIIADGTYVETLDIQQGTHADGLILNGQSQGGVIIDTSTFSDYGIDVFGDLTTTLRNFTLVGPPPAAYGYGIKISGENAQVTIHDVTVHTCGRSGIDLNGLVSGDLQNITSYDNGGVGLALTDCDDITVDGITTWGNAWGGMAVYTLGSSYTGGSDGVTLTGTNSFGELPAFYTETGGGYPITNLQVSTAEFSHIVGYVLAPEYEWYYASLTDAVNAVTAGGDPGNNWIRDRLTGELVVTAPLTIQTAINAASPGDEIAIAAGTYAEALMVNKAVTLTGAGEALVEIDGSTFTATSNLIDITADGVTMRHLTVNGHVPHYTTWPPAKPWYGINVSGRLNTTFHDLTVRELGKTGINLHGADTVGLTNVTCVWNGGAGVFTNDCHNVTFDSITTASNQWGGVAIATYGAYYPAGTSNMVFTGANSFGEATSSPSGYQGGLYLEDNTGGSAPISYKLDTDPGTADVTVQLADFTHIMSGPQDDALPRTRFYASLGDAVQAALQADDPLHVIGPGHFLSSGRYIQSLADGSFWVADGMQIQPAIDAASPGGVVNVDTGTYAESLSIAKALSLIGVAGAELVPGAGNDGIDIAADDITVQGLTIHDCRHGILGWLDSSDYAANFGYSNLHFLDNTIYDVSNGSHGFAIYLGTETERYNPADPIGIYDPSLTDLLDFTGLEISGNEIYNTSGAAVTLQSMRSYTASSLVLADNEIHDSAASGVWIDGCWDLSLTGNQLTSNANGIFFSNYGDGYYEGTPSQFFDPKNIEVVGCTIQNNSSNGIALYDGYPAEIDVTDNSMSGNGSNGFYNYLPATAYASCNWWGDIGGPDHVSNPNPAGDAVTDQVVFWPWLDSAGGTCNQYGPNTVAADVSAVPCLTDDTPCVVVPVQLVREAGAPLARAASVTFALSEELELCVDASTSIHQGTWLDAFEPPSGSGTTFQVVDNGDGSYGVDYSIVGEPCGETAGGLLFTIDVKASGSAAGEDTGTITVTDVEVTDCGAPVSILPGIPGPPEAVSIDTVDPSPIANLTSTQVLAGNTPGAAVTEIDLAWDPVTDADANVIEIWRKGYGTYPEYDDGGGFEPAAPADSIAADGAGWTLIATLPWGDTDYTDLPATRDFWYYVGFLKGTCGNESAASGLALDTHRNTAGTLNYHLGDVGAGGGDNEVDGLDISALGAAYGETDGGTYWNEYVDVGPTSNHSTHGLPTTDNVINFEDLLMFAINYGMVSFTGEEEIAELSTTVPKLHLELETVDANHFRAHVVLDENPGLVKGIHAVISHRGAVPIETAPGELLGSLGANVFFRDLPENGVGIHTAVLGYGATIAGDGEVASVLFEGQASASVQLTLVDLRDAWNRTLGDQTMAIGEEEPLAAAVPARYELLGAEPNPFNPSTTIRFRLPEATPVTLKIYDVSGRTLRLLHQGVLPAGEHGIRWDGRDASGRLLGSGVYLYAIKAGEIDTVEKLVLLK